MENTIDLGKWSVPTSWDELDLKMFQEIERYYSDKDKEFDVREVLHIFTEHTTDDINSLPYEFAEKIMEKLSWLGEEPKFGEPTNKIIIDGITYQVNVQEKLRTGEFIAVDTILKNDKFNYAAILAILCRKEGEIYDSKFENEIIPSRIELFESQSMMKVMPIISFFLALWVTLSQVTLLSSKVGEAISLTQQHIETLHKNGEISKRSMKSAMKKLRKLEGSIKSI